MGSNSSADYGTANGYAKIWKNGTITTLINDPGFSHAVGVTVVGQDAVMLPGRDRRKADII